MAADGKVQIDVELNEKGAIDGLNDIENSANRIGTNGSKQINSFGSRLASIGRVVAVAAAGVAGVGVAVGALAAPLVRAAGAAQALNAQFGQVFGTLEGEATRALNAIAQETGIIPDRLRGAFTQIAAFAKTTGVDTAGALDLTRRATLAAADSAAFYDRSIEETTESLQSFLKGNYENDAALGISATETTRNTKANELYGTSFIKLDEAQKQLTLLALVEDGNRLSGALGQAALESDGLENVLGNLRQAFTNLQAQLGNVILTPVIDGIKLLTQVINNIDVSAAIQKLKDLSSSANKETGIIQNVISTLKTVVETIVRALFTTVVPFFRTQLQVITDFWRQNGDDILRAVNTAFNAVKAVFDFILPAILVVVKFVWNSIESVISGALSVITGVVKVFSSALNGDWSGLWDGIKSIVSGAINLIVGILNLTFVGGIRTLFVNLAKNLLTVVRNNWTSIVGFFRGGITSANGLVSGLVQSVVNFFKNLATGSLGQVRNLFTNASTVFRNLNTTIVNVAKQLATGFVNQIRNLATNAISQGRNVATGLINVFKNLPSQFVTIGKQVIQGLINGIKSLNPISAISSIASGMVDRVRNIFDINSPSRVFTQIGEFVSQGLAIGIDNFAELPLRNIKKIADNVAKSGQDAARTAVSIIQEVKNEAQKEARTVTNDLNKELQAITKKANDDAAKVRKEAADKIKKLEQNEANSKKKNATKLAQEIAKINQQAESKITDIQTKATASRSSARDKANREIAKIESQINSDRLKALNEYAEAQKQSNNFSITEEIEFWKRAVKSFQDGSKEQTEARKKYNAAIDQYNKELITNTQNYISEQRDLNNITVLDEVDLWESVLNQLEIGSKEYITARKNYESALKEINDNVVKINQDFSNRIKTINDELLKNEQDLNKAYDDAYNKRFNALNNFAGLFDEFGLEVEGTGEQLLNNLQSQVTGLELFEANIDALAARGIGGDLLDELLELGPKALPQLQALNQLTDEQLSEYQNIYETRARLARERTEKELTDLRENTQSQIEQLRSDALVELNLLESEWQSQILAISQVTEDGLSSTRQIGVNAAQNLLDGLTSLEPTLVTRAQQIAESVSSALNSALGLNDSKVLANSSNISNQLRGTTLNLGEVGGIIEAVTSGNGNINNSNSKTQVNNITVYTNETDVEAERIARRLGFGF